MTAGVWETQSSPVWAYCLYCRTSARAFRSEWGHILNFPILYFWGEWLYCSIVVP